MSAQATSKPKAQTPDDQTRDLISRIEEDRRKLEEYLNSLIKRIEEETKKLKTS